MKKKLLIGSIVSTIGCGPIVIVLFLIIIGGAISSLIGDDRSSCETSAFVTTIDDKGKEENAKATYQYLIEVEGATPQGASGILGTLEFESQLNPSAENPSSGAYGLAQWLGGRKTALQNFAKKQGKDMNNLGVQLAFLSEELKNPYYEKAKNALKLTNVHDAQREWLLWFEGLSQDPSQWYSDQRNQMADKWYAKFGKSDTVAGDILLNASSGKDSMLECGTASYSGGDVLKMAESLIGYFNYSQDLRSQFGSVENPDKEGYTDCSSFVWLVLTRAGYKTPSELWFTGSMAADAKGSQNFLKAVNPSEAKAGDIVIVNKGSGVGNGGHTAILSENWHGLTTKIIESGGMQDSKVGRGQVDLSFGFLLDGGDLTIARPIKK